MRKIKTVTRSNGTPMVFLFVFCLFFNQMAYHFLIYGTEFGTLFYLLL